MEDYLAIQTKQQLDKIDNALQTILIIANDQSQRIAKTRQAHKQYQASNQEEPYEITLAMMQLKSLSEQIENISNKLSSVHQTFNQ